MKSWIAMVIVFLCLALMGVATLAGGMYVETGRGLHPALAGVVGLAALIAGLWASGEVEE